MTSPASRPKPKNPSAGVLVLTALGSILTVGLMMAMVLGPSAPDEEVASRSSSAPSVETTQQEPEPAPPVPSVPEPNPTIEPPVAPAPVTAPSPVQPVTTTPPQAAPSPVPAPIDESPRMEGTRAGEVRILGGIEMVWCPPGEFLMGSPSDEEGRPRVVMVNETQHRVTLTKGFWLAKTECTQNQWVEGGGSYPDLFKGADLPIHMVSWDEVSEWLKKKNDQNLLPAGWRWELPTEAQWEYACRAGSRSAYGGTGILNEMGWYSNSPDKARSVGQKVGQKQANAWGFYDMHGNVGEFCQDRYDGDDYATGSATDPIGPATGSDRAVRGGSSIEVPEWCRSARRTCVSPNQPSPNMGFRPAAVPAGR
jgi:hypothetical protein